MAKVVQSTNRTTTLRPQSSTPKQGTEGVSERKAPPQKGITAQSFQESLPYSSPAPPAACRQLELKAGAAARTARSRGAAFDVAAFGRTALPGICRVIQPYMGASFLVGTPKKGGLPLGFPLKRVQKGPLK